MPIIALNQSLNEPLTQGTRRTEIAKRQSPFKNQQEPIFKSRLQIPKQAASRPNVGYLPRLQARHALALR